MARDDPRTRFFATASRGSEEVLAGELAEIGVGPLEERRGGVAFGHTLEHGYRACLWSRVASRVLMPLSTFEARDAESLYRGVRAIRWSDHLGAGGTLAVQVAGSDAPAGPPHFVTLKTKDAVVDRIRDEQGARPNVDKRRPDVRIHVHLRGPRVTVSIDLAGRGLHHRGLGREGGLAPLRETLAAALLRIAGWPGLARDGAPLHDPMCGSGTLPLEAAAMALDVAPGLARDRTGFAGWRGHDVGLWDRLRAEARERRQAARRREVRIAGTDASARAIEAARRQLHRAGFDHHVRLEPGDLRRASPPWPGPGIVVTNPPYGERLGETGELGPLYESLGDVLRRRYPGWTAWVLSGNRALDKRIGLRPASRRVLFNGPIECRLLEIPISTAPVVRPGGPSWRRPGDEAVGFARKLKANAEHLAKWATRERVEAYRLYDADVPTYNVAVDRFGPMARVQEGPRPRKVVTAEAERRLRDVLQVVSETLDLRPDAIVLRVAGAKRSGAGSGRRRLTVREGALRFLADPELDPDGGLPLDQRLLRDWVRRHARGRDVLDLAPGTCATAVAAAVGGARSTTCVVASRQARDWARANFELNHRAAGTSRLIASAPREGRFDLILALRPRRAPALAALERLLAPDGELLLATGRRTRGAEVELPRGYPAREITEEITPEDFRRRPTLRAWVLRRARHGRSAR